VSISLTISRENDGLIEVQVIVTAQRRLHIRNGRGPVRITRVPIVETTESTLDQQSSNDGFGCRFEKFEIGSDLAGFDFCDQLESFGSGG
jgi:hypothetical protein